jgi:hypothetical protein
MKMPSPCDCCGEVVEYETLTQCPICSRWYCEDCQVGSPDFCDCCYEDNN